jgi:uncharacterized protein YhaN
MSPCPHCGGTTTTEPSRALRYVCGACGSPRIPGLQELGVKLDRGATTALAHAKTEWAKHLMARFVGFALVVMALFLAALALVAAATGHGAPAFGAAAIAALDFALATAVWSFARARLKASRESLDAGWASAASQIAQKRGGRITARELAVAMQTTEADADAILSKLSLGGARVEVDDDAQLHYRVESDGTTAAPEDGAKQEGAR